MSKLREGNLPFEVLEPKDYLKSIDELPVSDVLKFIVENGWCAVRPSGTEPKIKFYFCVKGKSIEDATNKIESLKQSFKNFLTNSISLTNETLL